MKKTSSISPAADHRPGRGCHDHHHGESPASDLKGLETRLKELGLKVTKPRQALLKGMMAFKKPFSAEDLYKSGKKTQRRSACDLVTVYRSLTTFSDLGLLTRVDFGDGVVRYELSDPSGNHHHHFVCQGCRSIEPLDFCEMSSQEKTLKERGYSRLSHRLEFFGLCPACSAAGS